MPDYKEEPPQPESVESLISTHPFLEGMSPPHLRLISDCAVRVHFRANDFVFREGAPANLFYLLRAGKVALESQTAGCTRKTIQILGPGDILGWSWLFQPCVWHFDAHVLEPTDAVFIYGTPLRQQCESDHDLGYELMKRLARVMVTRLQATRWQLLHTPAKVLEADKGRSAAALSS